MVEELLVVNCQLCGKEIRTVDALVYEGELAPLIEDEEDGFEKTFQESHLMCKSCGEWFWLDRTDAWHMKKREYSKREEDNEY